jgi:hypothetical protein
MCADFDALLKPFVQQGAAAAVLYKEMYVDEAVLAGNTAMGCHATNH